MPGPDTAAAQQHLEEMRDLAERILAMGNTLEARETGKPTIAVWDLGSELAELVRHYEPESTPRRAIGLLVDYSRADEERDYELQDEHGQANHIYNAIAEIDDWLEATTLDSARG